jgi:hypothetical protein
MLEHASAASETGSLKKFKAARKKVLEYLEPQCQRVLVASSNLAEDIKPRKRKSKQFDQARDLSKSRWTDPRRLAGSFIDLEGYAASMQRPHPRDESRDRVAPL